MRKIRVAQIGTSQNSHGNMIWTALVKNPDVFEIAGYAFPENEGEKFPKHAEKFQGYQELTVEQILADPTIEAVVIETEEIYLTKYAILAAKAGKHIHMEKPGGIDPAEFRELIGMMKQSGKVFHTGYRYRYNPVLRDIRKRIDAGELGQIISVEAQMNCIYPDATKRHWLGTFPGGMMFFLGCHLIDLVLLLQGTPKRIIPMNKSTGIDGVTAKDFGMVALEYEKGWSFIKTVACEVGGYQRRQLVITGTKGTIELKPFEIMEGPLHRTRKTEFFDTNWRAPFVSEDSQLFNRYAPMMIAFAEMVAGERENPYTLDYELSVYEMILQCCGETP